MTSLLEVLFEELSLVSMDKSDIPDTELLETFYLNCAT
jgi:hypothetical protein